MATDHRSRFHIITHVPFEGPGAIASWIESKNGVVTISDMHATPLLPGTDDFDWLIVMGGPMGVHDEDRHPWLSGEKRCIASAIDAGKNVVGVCLGAQLIADVLGARVAPNRHREIGWYDIERAAAGTGHPIAGAIPKRMTVFHWHGDTFERPDGAIHLARSEACENQGFIYHERVLALQFHIESTDRSVESLLRNCGHELVPGPYVQGTDAIRAGYALHGAKNNEVLYSLLDRLYDLR